LRRKFTAGAGGRRGAGVSRVTVHRADAASRPLPLERSSRSWVCSTWPAILPCLVRDDKMGKDCFRTRGCGHGNPAAAAALPPQRIRIGLTRNSGKIAWHLGPPH